jgi:predicted DNA-binding transcriptional regulator AlpA
VKRTVPKLAGLAEVAALLAEKSRSGKVSRSYAGQVANRPDFPAPVQMLAMGPVWLESDVQKFIDTPRTPGRKRKGA